MMNEFMIHDGKLSKYIGQNNNVVIPEGVTTIDYEAFRGRRNLTNIVIPEGVKYIHYGAFAGCQKLGQIRKDMPVSAITKYYSMCERAPVSDWCMSKGAYSLGEYSRECMPKMMEYFQI